ncbi:hypothetical protein ACJEEO_07245 [Phocaeicola coprocola]|uniref:hypothetical protein n=1 Tax=Phocaeicola coprocola TaxID=310298 RepID=UPI003979C4BE
MGKTNKANWEKAKDLLLTNGVTEEEINNKLTNKNNNKEKFEALNELLIEKGLELRKKVSNDYPTIQEYFGKRIADLLIRRKELLDIECLNIDRLKDKSIEELSISELQQIIKFKSNKKANNELDKIYKSLEEFGIKFVEPKK